MKFGKEPVVKFYAFPKSIESINGESSQSGSYNFGNFRGILSPT